MQISKNCPVYPKDKENDSQPMYLLGNGKNASSTDEGVFLATGGVSAGAVRASARRSKEKQASA